MSVKTAVQVTARVFGLAAILLAGIALAQPLGDQPPHDYVDVRLHPRFAFSPEKVRESIIIAGARRNWMFEDAGPGHLVGTLYVRTHLIMVDISYTGERYSILYKDSTNMRYRNGLIHSNYNRWVRELSEAFTSELAAVAMTNPQAVVPSEPVTRVLTTAGVPAAVELPKVGDTWNYRLVRKGKTAPLVPGYTVTIEQASVDGITDRITMGGDAPLVRRHEPQPATFLDSGWATEVSPYLVAFGGEARLRSSEAHSADRRICTVSWECTQRARLLGRETISVPGGTFDTFKLVVEQNWASPSLATVAMVGSREIGSRTITVWYSSLLRRAVKFESRGTQSAWLETNCDVELMSFRLN